MTLGQVIEIGPLHFSVLRMLLAVGAFRVIIRGERLKGSLNGLDKMILVWSSVALISSFFHEDAQAALIYRLGLVYNACGIYFLLRIFCQSIEDVVWLCCLTALLLVPVAAEMIYENLRNENLFSALGGLSENPAIREGRIRAQGPFGHAIIAGTVGAVCLPLMIGLWQHNKRRSMLGIAACFAMILSCASTGPIMSTLFSICAVLMWKYHKRMRLVRWIAVLGYIGLELVMKAPAYYLLARIDITGGSTGWHRARLIEVAIENINEWWFAGTDYTRHWMPYGVYFSENHADITNYFLEMGIVGGLALMFIFIMVLAKGFSFVGQEIRHASTTNSNFQFMIWAIGASLFTHAGSMTSITYFDQSFLFLYLTLAAIGSIHSETALQKA